jgi:hypothetical protein
MSHFKTKDWRFGVDPAHDGVWLHFSTNTAVIGGTTLLNFDEAERLAAMLKDAIYGAEAARLIKEDVCRAT